MNINLLKWCQTNISIQIVWKKINSPGDKCVMTTSFLRQNDAVTSFWRDNTAIFTSYVRWGMSLAEQNVYLHFTVSFTLYLTNKEQAISTLLSKPKDVDLRSYIYFPFFGLRHINAAHIQWDCSQPHTVTSGATWMLKWQIFWAAAAVQICAIHAFVNTWRLTGYIEFYTRTHQESTGNFRFGIFCHSFGFISR